MSPAAETVFPPTLIRDRGDDLEKKWAPRLLDSIPHYALIWANYIGNTGDDDYLPMNDASEESSNKRREFWEHAYTAFESLALIWELEGHLILEPAIITVSDYATLLNRWIVFFAHIGRIHDMVKKIEVMKLRNGGPTLQDTVPEALNIFFRQRNIVLHGPKVPMKRVDSLLFSPPVGEAPRQWRDRKMRWHELGDADYVAIGDYVSDNLKQLESALDSFFSRVFPVLPNRFGFRPVVWPFAGLRGVSIGDIPNSNFEQSRAHIVVDAQWFGGSGIYHE